MFASKEACAGVLPAPMAPSGAWCLFPASSEALRVSIASGWSPVGRYASKALNRATGTRYPRPMRLTLALAVVLAALAAAPSAYACACCAEKNAWFEYSDRLDTREAGRLMFGGLPCLHPGTAA